MAGDSAEASIFVQIAVREERRTVISIIYKILGFQMIPMLEPMDRSKRKPLVEYMIAVIDLAKAIGIIHQSMRRRNMKLRIVGAVFYKFFQ